ncbi:hypothetical protein XELAEV_18040281mg [Xenopus laevis]|uniref:G-protein coupled receptors family 3 profile domain-containing protein n=1 Tax=Xenopus laevis TaxID=8355 RepID=A0A974H8S9_XENLA|nr:hypothetical protein XELAEV_18040281mg [Xenopus laevis]
MEVTLYKLILLMILPHVVGRLTHPNCALELKYTPNYIMEGDFIIGGLITVWSSVMNFKRDFNQKPYENVTFCNLLNIRNYQTVLAFIFAIEEINRNPDLLPNITLGFHIIDTCSNEERVIAGMFDILSGGTIPVPNFSCCILNNVVGVVDGISSKNTILLARLLGMYRIPQVSCSSLDVILSDKLQFPAFYRTVPSDDLQCAAIVHLLKYFHWTWVGLFVSDDESGLKISQMLQKDFAKNEICVAFLEFLPLKDYIDETRRPQIAKNINSTNVIIVYGDRNYMFSLQLQLFLFPIPEKVWIISSQWDITFGSDLYFLSLQPFNGSLAFALYKTPIPNFEKFTQGIRPDLYPKDIFIDNVWFWVFQCKWKKNASDPEKCTGKEKLQYDDLTSYSYIIYNAVYALAHALHSMYSSNPKKQSDGHYFKSWKLHKYLKNLYFTNNAGSEVFFDDNGNMPLKFEILNWIVYPNDTLDGIKVGNFDPQHAYHNFTIHESLIRWSSAFNQTPHSTCSETCLPGYRKSPKVGHPTCCHDCIPCLEGEISNQTDMEECIKCPENQWSNTKRDMCVYKIIIYLSYEEPLGTSLVLISIIFFFLTCFVSLLFTKYRKTPIVKANNQDLSYILLFSLKTCFLCNLLFIGHPIQVTCILRQTIFGVTFSISLSSILAKTITVIIAFNVTKPASKLRNWMRSRVPNLVVFVCSLFQMTICAGWLGTSPPFPYYNMEDEIGMIIAQCNEGSALGFYCVLGFTGILSCVCFIIAFFARNLPNSFNEAKFITFSMLVFCSVWISFVPAYLSTKGKYVVAVEIFAIQASSMALLGCIFIPKCYIILVKPECNTRNFVKKMNCIILK